MTAWYETPQWASAADRILGDERREKDALILGRLAVVLDRRILAEQIRVLPWGHALGDVSLGDVLALLEDADPPLATCWTK